MLGQVSEIWRYPVKSMQGEPLGEAAVLDTGVIGDRALALRDVETGQIASAKSPRLWPDLLDFQAAFVDDPQPGSSLPAVRITLPDGDTVRSDDADVEVALSQATGRTVTLVSSNPAGETYEQYLPDIDGADPRGADVYTRSPNDVFGTGSLHDAAPLHLITTASLDQLGALHPEGRPPVRRFRPNVVVATEDGLTGFAEDGWLKEEVALGDVSMRVTLPMGRCVMITRPQPGLAKDAELLRTVTRHNRQQVLDIGRLPCVGVAGLVEQAGVVRCGDQVVLHDRRGPRDTSHGVT